MPRAVLSYGASVRGPLHRKESRPNEDAWLHTQGRYGLLVVVCDGMGSRPQSRVGARAACVAAREAVAKWAQVDDAPLSYLANLTEALWRLRIHPNKPSDAATTCLLALARRDGEWIVGGVGDGLLAVRTGNGPTSIVVGDRDEGFCNETCGLGVSPGPNAWRLSRLPASPEERVGVLATDGVADDLRPEKLGALCDWLVNDFRVLRPLDRWRMLTNELSSWPTPRHLDDKTLAVLYSSAQTTGEVA
jgi:hypothetical protein